MAGFIRRYGFFPGIETITLIEGVVIVDLPPPGAINGISAGTVGMVGEFSDLTYATQVDAAGVVTTKSNPVEIFSGQDLFDKLGNFDSTIGNNGNNGGNGFLSLRNKQFTRLVVAPVNLAAAGAGRAWRDLPTNLSATQAVPCVPLTGGTVAAGREFRSAANRVRVGKRVNFTALGHYKNGIDGAITAAGSLASQTFNSATGGFLVARDGGPVKKGDLLVLGVISGAGALGANAATYRVLTDAASATALVVQKLDGTNFDWTTGTAQPYRVHKGSDADSGGFLDVNAALADTSGYKLPCRPLDATIAAATSCAPTVVPAAGTASSWDSLSGLTLRSHSSAGFVYVAAVMAPNAVNDTTIDALYVTAIDGMKQDTSPARDINIVYSARTSTVLRNKLKSHALECSSLGLGRMSIIAPNLQTVSTSVATADADPGVGANRDERVVFSWPGAQTFVPEAVGFPIGTADGLTTTDGLIDTPGDGWLAAMLSALPPENNPGQAGEPAETVLAPILSLQRGLAALTMQDYIAMRQYGICGLKIDRTSGPIFQSGVTTSLVSGQKNIARRRMADFIQDSVAAVLVNYSKKPLTQGLKDTCVGQVDSFLDGLLSPLNPSAQRIKGYKIDDKSGNTPTLEAAGIFVIIGKVRSLASADDIVFQTEVGENVVVSDGVTA